MRRPGRRDGAIPVGEGREAPEEDDGDRAAEGVAPEERQVCKAWRQAGVIGHPVLAEDFSVLVRMRRMRKGHVLS